MPTIAGPRSASAFATDAAGIGSTDWTNPNDVADPDAGYATSEMTDTGLGIGASYFLMLTDFGFDIPADATITGIFVVWRAAQNADVNIASTQLLKAGVADGTDYGSAGGGSLTKLTGSYYPYGGLKNLWGTTWTPAEVNASDFGVRIAFSTAAAPQTAELDFVFVLVQYRTSSERVYTVDCACCPGGDPCCANKNGVDICMKVENLVVDGVAYDDFYWTEQWNHSQCFIGIAGFACVTGGGGSIAIDIFWSPGGINNGVIFFGLGSFGDCYREFHSPHPSDCALLFAAHTFTGTTTAACGSVPFSATVTFTEANCGFSPPC